jgi:hypothetical protein
MKKETKLSDVIISLVSCPSSLMSDCSVYTCSLPLVNCSKVGSTGNGKYSDGRVEKLVSKVVIKL